MINRTIQTRKPSKQETDVESDEQSVWIRYAETAWNEFNEREKTINPFEAKNYLNGQFLNEFQKDVFRSLNLREESTYTKVMDTRDILLNEDGVSEDEATKMAIDKRKFLVLDHAPDWEKLL